MLWLKARSLMALGITTATRNGSAGTAVGSGGASVGAAVPHAPKSSAAMTRAAIIR